MEKQPLVMICITQTQLTDTKVSFDIKIGISPLITTMGKDGKEALKSVCKKTFESFFDELERKFSSLN